MACNDITVVATRGNLSRFQDTYTRDHATPREDTVLGGQDDLTAAVAFEDPATNTVTAIFRKKLTGDFFEQKKLFWTKKTFFRKKKTFLNKKNFFLLNFVVVHDIVWI